MIAATQSAVSRHSVSQAHTAEPLATKAAGLAFVAIISALFWMAAAAVAGHLLGFAVTAKGLMTIGSTVALFLTVVCAPIILRN